MEPVRIFFNRWFSLDVFAAMLVHRTIEKKSFGNLTLMQNTSRNLLLFCPPTWPSHHVTENHLYLILGYLYPMTDTIVTDNFNTYVNHLANKHVGHVKPFYAAPFDDLTFDVWTRETVFREVGGVVGDLGI